MCGGGGVAVWQHRRRWGWDGDRDGDSDGDRDGMADPPRPGLWVPFEGSVAGAVS